MLGAPRKRDRLGLDGGGHVSHWLQDAMEGHTDAIMDCAYNFHGTRLATCAADRRIIVWDQSADGQWTHSCAPLERHTSAVYKVDWAHPEFGQVIASCSADRTVIVWEETQNRCRPHPPTPFIQ